MPLSDDDVREILRIIDESGLTELRIETEGFALYVRKGEGDGERSARPRVRPGSESGRARGAPADRESGDGPPGRESRDAPPGRESRDAPPGRESRDAPPDSESAAPRTPAPPAAAQTDGLVTITAPMLGTFFRAEAPGQPPFVEVGKQIDPDTIVCIIEVMKMMNSVPAGVSGTVAEIVAKNAELVEYGQPLFRVAPA